MTSRRGFIAQLAALVAAGTAAPAILAQLRPSSRVPSLAADSFMRADAGVIGGTSHGAWTLHSMPAGTWRLTHIADGRVSSEHPVAFPDNLKSGDVIRLTVTNGVPEASFSVR